MEWSGRVPAPPASYAGKGRQRQGARYVPRVRRGRPPGAARARATGLLGQRQSITHIKVFKRAKRSLGIRSVRTGFGARSRWLWQLPQQSEASIEPELGPFLERRVAIPIDWVQGVACL